MKAFKKNLLTMFLSQGGRVLLGVVSTLLLARFLGAEERGVFAIAITIPTVLSLVLSLGLPQVNFIFCGLYQNKRNELFSISMLACLITNGFAILLILILDSLGISYFGKIVEEHEFIILPVCILVVLYTFNFVLREMLKGMNEIILISKIIFFEGVGIFLGYSVCFFLKLQLLDALFVQIIVSGVTFCILLVKALYLTKFTLRIKRIFTVRVFKAASVYFLGSISIAIALHSPVLFMNYFSVDFVAIACFSIAFSLVQQCELVPSVLVNVLLPKLSNKKDSSKETLLSEVLFAWKANFIVFLLVMLMLSVGVYYVFIPLLGSEYADVGNLFFILALGSIIASSAKIINIYFNLVEKPFFEMIPTWVRCIIQILLCFVFVNSYGVYGVAWAVFFSRLVRILISVKIFTVLNNISVLQMIPNNSDLLTMISYIQKKKESI
jgi:O-antigen/teichoic acid export membrane protein